MAESIIKVKGLKKDYAPILYRLAKLLKIKPLIEKLESKVQYAVDGISFSVKSGEICGLLGPNGAGKSTTIKTIVGLISSKAGDIEICGKNLKKYKTQILNQIGGVIENPEMYKNLSGRANLKYFATLRGGISDKRIDEVLKTVELLDRAKDKFSNYSLGMKQRLGIAQAIMHKPRLLILDEPANGLDPQGIIDLRKMLRKLAREEGMAIIVSSHQLSEMQMICDRVIIMNKGKIVAKKSISELSETEDGKVNVTFTADKVEDAIKLLKEKYDIDAMYEENKVNALVIKDKVPEITKELLLSGIMISGVNIKENSLEDLFVELTGGVE